MGRRLAEEACLVSWRLDGGNMEKVGSRVEEGDTLLRDA